MNQTQQLKKPDKYKPLFCDVHFYVKHQQSFSGFQKSIESYDISIRFALWCLFLCLLRRPDDWFNGFRISHNQKKSGTCAITLKPFFHYFQQLTWPSKLQNDLGLTDFISMVRIKAIPDCINESLDQILAGHYF